MLKKCLLSVFILVSAAQAWSQTMYVRDTLYVNVHSGKGYNYRIIETGLRSGAELEQIRAEEDDQGRSWTFVETENGNQGWVESQYLQGEMIAEDRLAATQRELAALRERQQSSGGQISELELQNAQLTEDLNTARAQIEALTTELTQIKRVSANAMNLDSQNQQLIQEREELKTTIDVLTNQNEQLRDDSNQTWFLYGAFAVGIGCLLTLIVQKIRIRRRYSEWA